MSKNPFDFSSNYQGLDLQDFNAEEAYEMGVSAGMDSSKQQIEGLQRKLKQGNRNARIDEQRRTRVSTHGDSIMFDNLNGGYITQSERIEQLKRGKVTSHD